MLMASGHTSPDRRRRIDDAPLISSLRIRDSLLHSVVHMLGGASSLRADATNDEGRLVSLGGLASALLENDSVTA